MVKNELAEFLGEPSEEDWLSGELEYPLEGGCMEDQGLGCSLFEDSKLVQPMDPYKGRYGHMQMHPGQNRTLLSDHAYGIDPGVPTGDFYSRFQRGIHSDNACDTDEQSSGETLGRFQLDEPGLDYHKQSSGTLIPDLLSTESSRSSISQLPDYQMGAGGNGQNGFSRNHSTFVRKVTQGPPCEAFNVHHPSYHIGNTTELSPCQGFNVHGALPVGHSPLNTLSQGLVQNLTLPSAGSPSPMHLNSINKGMVLPNGHKPCFGEIHDPRSLSRMSLQSLSSSQENAPHAGSLLYRSSESELPCPSRRMVPNGLVASSPTTRCWSTENIRKYVPQAMTSLADTTHRSVPILRDSQLPGTGKLSKEEREQKIRKYLQKKMGRRFDRRVTYPCRKTLADTRPRVRGRFAKNGDKNAVMPGGAKPSGKKRKLNTVQVCESPKRQLKGGNMGDQENMSPHQYGGNKSLIARSPHLSHL